MKASKFNTLGRKTKRPRIDSKKKGKIRIDFYIQQRGVCAYCKKHTDFKYWTLDHKIPRSKGGSNKLKNLVGCCTFCNAIKADRYFHDC